MIPAELTSALKRNLHLITRDTAGISDADALKRIGQGSSLNWVVGHILATRTRLLDMLNLKVDGVNTEELRALYGTKTAPDSEKDIPLSQLLNLLNATQTALEEAIPSADLLPLVQSPFGEKTLGELINFFAWHEGYHAGQTVIFKRWLEG